jgi:hypothetical protein
VRDGEEEVEVEGVERKRDLVVVAPVYLTAAGFLLRVSAC